MDEKEKCVEWGKIVLCVGDLIEVGVARKIIRGRVVDIDTERLIIVVQSENRTTSLRLFKTSYITKL